MKIQTITCETWALTTGGGDIRNVCNGQSIGPQGQKICVENKGVTLYCGEDISSLHYKKNHMLLVRRF